MQNIFWFLATHTHTFCFLNDKFHAIVALSAKVVLYNPFSLTIQIVKLHSFRSWQHSYHWCLMNRFSCCHLLKYPILSKSILTIPSRQYIDVIMTSPIFPKAIKQWNLIDISEKKRQEPDLSVLTATNYFSSATYFRYSYKESTKQSQQVLFAKDNLKI